MENEEFEGKENCSNKMLLRECSLAHVNKLQSGTHYMYGNKTGRLHNANVWIWMAIIQHAEST